jgi:hypothetical protein
MSAVNNIKAHKAIFGLSSSLLATEGSTLEKLNIDIFYTKLSKYNKHNAAHLLSKNILS